jgi:flavodoxin
MFYIFSVKSLYYQRNSKGNWKLFENIQTKWKASYFCSYQQRLYSILVCKSAIPFGISPLEVLEQKWRVQNILTLLQTVFRIQIDSELMFYWSISRVLSKKKGFSFFGLTDFEIWRKIGIKWKITLLMIVKWKGSYFCSYQQRLYSILVCKSAIPFGISPLEVLEQKRDVLYLFM